MTDLTRQEAQRAIDELTSWVNSRNDELDRLIVAIDRRRQMSNTMVIIAVLFVGIVALTIGFLAGLRWAVGA